MMEFSSNVKINDEANDVGVRVACREKMQCVSTDLCTGTKRYTLRGQERPIRWLSWYER